MLLLLLLLLLSVTSAMSLVSNQVFLASERFPTLVTCCCVLGLVMRLHVTSQTAPVSVEPSTYSGVRHLEF